MTSKFLHEEIYRGAEQVAKLAIPQIVICGAGAIGSHLADNLVRQGFRRLRVIDRDRVEQHNISTQLYDVGDVGAWKVEVLRNRIFRAAEVEIETLSKELTDRNVRTAFKGADVVIDAFDNSGSRQLVQNHCRASSVECLHVGLYADYCEVIWDQEYRVPRDVAGDVCEYPLARNLVMLAVAIASESLLRFLLNSARESRSATLEDLAIVDFERPVIKPA
jgi:molybdopterin-synthase adenylyltransferase